MAKTETAEQKLLKMIEASAAPEVSKVEEKPEKKIDFLSFIKIGNRILMGGVILAGFLLVNEVRAGIMLLGREVRFSGVRKVVGQGQNSEIFFPVPEDLSFYLFGVKRRNLFYPFEEVVKNIVDVSDQNRRIAQKTENLRLVGVSWLDSVETASVMIEDTDKKITHFLQEGEKVGEIIVKTIYADSVELGYENEEIIIQYDKSQM